MPIIEGKFCKSNKLTTEFTFIDLEMDECVVDKHYFE